MHAIGKCNLQKMQRNKINIRSGLDSCNCIKLCVHGTNLNACPALGSGSDASPPLGGAPSQLITIEAPGLAPLTSRAVTCVSMYGAHIIHPLHACTLHSSIAFILNAT